MTALDRIIALEHAIQETVVETGRPPMPAELAQLSVPILLEKLWDRGVVLEYSSRLVWQRLVALVTAGFAGFSLAHLL